MSLALYRKYRSRSLNEIVGQSHVTKLLAQAIKQDKVAHAYLFTGPRGVGKTSIARILAHELNDLPYDDESTHLDIIEIDAASNNGVEDIRDLRERVQIAPVSAKKKVYIIDEVHMLSKPAFNALLKTLEEPPEHVVFILATTDIDKVPETILSRTQRHSFKRASIEDIVTNLERIAKAENIKVEREALELIARHADGSFRDSVSLFDQLQSGHSDNKVISAEQVQASLGLASNDHIQGILDAVLSGDVQRIAAKLDELEAKGVSARIIARQLSELVRERLAENPNLLSLLDSLLDIHQSAYPELKLLTTLGMFVPPQPSAPASTPQAQVRPASKAVATSQVRTKPTELQPAPEVKAVKKQPKKINTSDKPFDWNELLAHVKANHVAIHSVLCKCEPELDGDTLILYTRTAFYKKKLDDTKYRVLLNDSLAELGFGHIEIETRPTTKPLKDGHAAKVAAIMGGGEEVGVDDAA
jgi:DNA polymerase III subunit gamma/tau